jgi:chromosome segregation ATPase
MSGSETMYLAMSLGDVSTMDGTTGRLRNDSAASAASLSDSSRKMTVSTPTLLQMLKTSPMEDHLVAQDEDNNRNSPTSVTVDSIDDKSKEIDTAPAESAVEHNKESSHDLCQFPVAKLKKDDDTGDESVDDDDEIVLDTSSSRKSIKIAALELALEQAQAQRTKMIANIQKKKQVLVETESNLKVLERENAEMKKSLSKMSLENSSLHSGLASITSVRDELRNKLRIKQDVLRETRAEKDEIEKKLKRCEQHRQLEQELLQNYRKLAIHTGYFRWGKEIRMLESALEKANAEQQD